MQNRKKFNIINLVIFALSINLIFSLSYVYSKTNSNAENQSRLKIVKEKIQNTKNSLEKVRKDKNNVLAQIKSLDMTMDKAQKSINTLNYRIQISNNNISRINKRMRHSLKTCKKQKKVLYDRLEEIYEGQDESFLDVLLNSKNFTDFFCNIELFNEVVEYDNDMLKKYKSTVNKIKKDKKRLQKASTILIAYKKEQQNKISNLQSAMKNKQKIAGQLENNEAIYEQSMNELQRTSDQIESQLQKIQKHSTVKYVSGGYTWPTPGCYRINSPFGYRIHPIFHTKKLHTGLDIGASYGTAIRATHSGVVVMAGWYGGYGKAVIIDHGNGMASLYGHCSSLNVVVNQKVSAGDIIAHVGSTGNSTGPHLHFEIRQNGTPVNPFNYVK